MKKFIILVVIALAIVVAGGSYLFFHKSSKPTNNSSQSASSNNVPAVNNAVLATKTNPSVGQYLASPSGKTLYIYNADTSGVSNCTDSCLTVWPAYIDSGSATNLPAGVGTIKRSDNGQIQYTYNGMPLYFFANDSNGQVTGNNAQNFIVARPMANPTTNSSQSTTSPSTNSTPQSTTNSNPSYNY